MESFGVIKHWGSEIDVPNLGSVECRFYCLSITKHTCPIKSDIGLERDLPTGTERIFGVWHAKNRTPK